MQTTITLPIEDTDQFQAVTTAYLESMRKEEKKPRSLLRWIRDLFVVSEERKKRYRTSVETVSLMSIEKARELSLSVRAPAKPLLLPEPITEDIAFDFLEQRRA